MTSSLGVMVVYWSWYTYYSYDSDSLVYDDQTGVCLVLTVVFLVAVLPVCIHYRNIELEQVSRTRESADKETRRQARPHRRHHCRERDRSPPPKYQESLTGPQ